MPVKEASNTFRLLLLLSDGVVSSSEMASDPLGESFFYGVGYLRSRSHEQKNKPITIHLHLYFNWSVLLLLTSWEQRVKYSVMSPGISTHSYTLKDGDQGGN